MELLGRNNYYHCHAIQINNNWCNQLSLGNLANLERIIKQKQIKCLFRYVIVMKEQRKKTLHGIIKFAR